MLCEVTGRDLKSVSMPKAMFSAWGRAGDLTRRFGLDLILTSEGVEYMYNTCAGDNSFTEQDTGVTLRSTGTPWPTPSPGCATRDISPRPTPGPCREPRTKACLNKFH